MALEKDKTVTFDNGVTVTKGEIKKTEGGYAQEMRIGILPKPPSNDTITVVIDGGRFGPKLEVRSKDEARQAILDLANKVNAWNVAYYVHNDPVVIDAEYDGHMYALKELERIYPEFKIPGSPTESVGAPIDGTPMEKKKHFTPMLSLDNAFTEKELDTWAERLAESLGMPVKKLWEQAFSLEPKIDGLSLNLMYVKKNLAFGVTRGDGSIGELVTGNCKRISDIPNTIPEADHSFQEIRGEVYMSKEAFAKANAELLAEGKKPFATPRNAAAGLLRRVGFSHEPLNLGFFVYGIGMHMGDHGQPHMTQIGVMSELKKLGFSVPVVCGFGNSRESILKYIQSIYEMRATLPYDIDGVVIKLSDFKMCSKAGSTSKFPRWAIAWKFPGDEAQTYVKEVVNQIGRSGVVTPVANLEPINIGGVVVSRASLHNYDMVKQLGITIGGRVVVVRSGDVIPKITQSIPGSTTSVKVAPPTHCPVCGSLLKEIHPKLFCTNKLACSPQAIGAIEYACSRDVLNVVGFGEQVITDLFNAGIITSVGSVFNLSNGDIPRIEALPGYGRVAAQSLIASVRAVVDSATLERVIASFGIPNVGVRTSVDLVQQLANRGVVRFTDFVSMSPEDKRKILSGTHGIGPVIENSIIEFFEDAGTRKGALDILEALNSVIKIRAMENLAAKQVVVFTGTMSEPRHLMAEKARSAGYTVDDSVTKKTAIVVFGANPSAAKLAKLEKNPSITIFNETGWREHLGKLNQN